MEKTEYPPAGTWDVIDRRYVIEHDGKGGCDLICQPENPEHCNLLAAAKDLLVALKEMVAYAEMEHKGLRIAELAIAKAEGR